MRDDLATALTKLESVAISSKEVSKVVKTEFNKINTRVDTLKDELIDSGYNAEALEALHVAIGEVTAELAKNAVGARDDTTALRVVMNEATNAIRIISAQVETLQAEVM